MATGKPCPFCHIATEHVVAEDALVFAIRDAYPVSPGHTLIIPKRHIRSITEATPDEEQALWRMAATARAQLDAEHHPDGYNIGINDGVAAGQTVVHLHVHLIPRYAGDATDPRGGVRHCIPGKGYYPPEEP